MTASFVADLFVHSEEALSPRDADAQVSWRCRSQCRPGTGAASENCRLGTGASVSPTYRNFTVASRWTRDGAGFEGYRAVPDGRPQACDQGKQTWRRWDSNP